MTQKNNKQAIILEEALTRFIDECQQGGQPDIDEFARQYPKCEAQLKRRIRDLHEIDFLFDSIVQADGSEFEDTITPHDLVGQKLASFEVEKVIGQGGMGVVYLARDTKLDRYVAIKSLPTGLLSNSIRLQNEAKVLASLNHPNIAVIYDIIKHDDGLVYLILEYVPGETLAQRIDREPLKLDEALSICRQIAEAISAAHKKGIIHRDLKPGNIKITPEGRVKVLDFGLAKPFTREGKNNEITEAQPDRVIGTPAYMSPEQARGKATDHRTDIWSFGCILYEMLTGRLPFEGETTTDTLARIIKREPDWERLPQDTPENIRTLLRRCLEKDPDQRLQNIAGASVEISHTLTQSVTASRETLPAKPRRMTMVMGAMIVIVLAGTTIWFGLNRDTEFSSEAIRLVVLPFEHLGSENDEDYSSAISTEIISRLVGIRGLAVSSGEIAENRAMLMSKKFGVDYILKGTVQCMQLSDPNRQMLRIRPQLIRISNGQYIWAEPYDKDISQIHKIPSELAGQVAQALNLTLPETEHGVLASEPTEEPEAYLWYLRGNDYFRRSYLESDLTIAIQMYENAVKRDPTFALAFAQLSRAHVGMYWFHGYSKQHLFEAKKAVEKAFQLNPELPEVRFALGDYYYHCLRKYDQALEQFSIARQSLPNNSDLLSFIAFVKRRQGKLRQALAILKEAYEIDPLSNTLAIEIANTQTVLREYPEAERFYRRGILLAPNVSMPYHRMALLYLFWEGRTEKAWAILKEALQNAESPEEESRIVYVLVMLHVYDTNYEEALTQLSYWPEKAFDINRHYIPKDLLYAMIYGYMGNHQLEQAYYESARGTLVTKSREDPNDLRLHRSLGIAYAGLGQKKEAIAEGKKGKRMDLARIYVMVGDYDAAIDQIKNLLSKPGELSIPFLRLDPAWDPLRDHPRFKELIQSAN